MTRVSQTLGPVVNTNIPIMLGATTNVQGTAAAAAAASEVQAVMK